MFLLWDRSLGRGLTIVFCSGLIWGGLFAASWTGFHYLKEAPRNIPLDGPLMERLFDLFFMILTIFLLFSTGIILYSSLFDSQESAFLLSGPVRADRIFAYKFQGALAFSSWAFVLLGSPILLAYGLEVNQGAPWYFFPLLLFFFVGYVLIPGALGAAITLALVNFAPRRRRQLVIFVSVGLLLLGLVRGIFWLREMGQNPFGTQAWFDTLLGELDHFQSRWLPHHWLARGLVSSAQGDLVAAAFNLSLIWSNGLLLFVLVAWGARAGFRRGYNLVTTGGDLRRRYGGHFLDRLLDRLVFFLHPQTRLLIVKDFRAFRRDPAQLWQILILLGLALFYFSYMRRFYQRDLGRNFQNGISILTLAAASFWLCAYTGRFIFPLLSLEGRKFWILGLLPLDRQRLLWGKFAFSAGGCLALSATLVLVSDLMLGMPWLVFIAHGLCVIVLSLGLSGLSVGLGACLPNFRETDPSKIAVGFGGTLNLVTGLLFLLTTIGLIAGPTHLWLAWQINKPQSPAAPWWVWLGMALGLAIGLCGIVFPLRAGARNLRKLEF